MLVRFLNKFCNVQYFERSVNVDEKIFVTMVKVEFIDHQEFHYKRGLKFKVIQGTEKMERGREKLIERSFLSVSVSLSRERNLMINVYA